jgi:DNA-binding MarR family transcriptional regulator
MGYHFIMKRNDRVELARVVMDLIDEGHRRISRRIDLTRVRVLGTVAAHGPMRPSAIAAALRLTAPTTSRHLAALERAGQVTVQPDPDDSRTFLVLQTGSGRAELDATIAAGAAVFARVIADWSDEDVATALRLISRLNAAWAQHHTRPTPAPAPGQGPRWLRTRQSIRTDQETN